MIIQSVYWDEALGVCEKHGFARIPCQLCLDQHDPDVEIKITETDKDAVASDSRMTVRDLFPKEDADWLLAKVVN